MAKIDYGRYKDRFIEFLQKRGIHAQRGLIRCFSPSHEDKNPSCEIFEGGYKCYACGIRGDIYDAVEVLDGISDRREQYNMVARILGGEEIPAPNLKKNYTTENKTKENFSPDAEAVKTLEEYLKKNPARKQKVLEFWETRAKAATGGRLENYPEEVQKSITDYLLYWPGLTAAKYEIGIDALKAAGIPMPKRETGRSSWDMPGVVCRLGKGFKLQFYANNVCEKRGSKGCSTFPNFAINTNQRVVLVEGENDCLVMRAAGIPNVIACGGTNGLTKPKTKQHLLGVSEIVILFDNDEPGKKASGIIPLEANDKQKTNLPETLLLAGFTGKIKIASLEKIGFKDPDEAILNGCADDVAAAINEAIDYVPPKKETAESDAEDALMNTHDNISINRLKSILDRVAYEDIDEDDVKPFVWACVKACNHHMVENALIEWSRGAVRPELIKQKNDTSAYYLLEACEKYGVTNYIKKQLQNELVPGAEIIKSVKTQKSVVPIDFEKIEALQEFQQFILMQDVRSAAMVVAKVFDGKLIYVENEKRNYFFNGHVWVRIPDIAGDVCDILNLLLKDYLGKHTNKKTLIVELLKKVGGRRFRAELTQDLNGLKKHDDEFNTGVFREKVNFDGYEIGGTLTLLDCVIDFSGSKIEYRASRPEEYRMEMLPYTREQFEKAGEPVKFMEFMRGNFKNEDTLKTLLYYLSLIPSRNTGYKYGGIFLGVHNTGKSTTLNLMEAIYSGVVARIKSDVLVSTNGRKSGSGNEATPEIAKMEGKCAVFIQETARNAYLNTNFWKELTGGDTLTARGLYKEPRDFKPTAQVIIASNYAPKFDAHDDAAISRMMVIPFNVQHKKTDKGAKTSEQFITYLRPEFPAIIKHFIEIYIDLNINLHGNIPLSEECARYRGVYVDAQATDLDRFVADCITFEMAEDVYETVEDVYNAYLRYYNLSADDKEALTRPKFTRYLKNDYREIQHKQKRINNYPVWCFFNTRLKDDRRATSADGQGTFSEMKNSPPPVNNWQDNEMPDDNPFG